MKKFKSCLLMIIFIIINKCLIAQIGIGVAIPATNAQLEIASSTKGLLIPRMTATQKDAIVSPTTGLTIFQTTAPTGYYFYDASWKYLAPSSDSWTINGNTGTTTSTAAIGATVNNNFIGSSDAKDLVIATNNLERIRITSAGNTGFGNIAPTQKLELTNGNFLLSNTGTAGELRFAESSTTGTNYTAFKAQAQAANITYTLPNADGLNGQMLTTNGTGGLSWVNSTTLQTVSSSTINGAGTFSTLTFPSTTAGNIISATVAVDGIYLILFTGSIYGATGNKAFSIQLFTGTNTGITNSRINSQVPNGAQTNGAATHSVVAGLTAGAVIGLRGLSGDGTVFTMNFGNLILMKIG